MAFGTVVQSLEYQLEAASLTLDWSDGSTPVSGNLIILVGGNRNTVSLSTPSGYTLAHSDEPWSGSSSTKTYIWYKIASSSESNVTISDGNADSQMYLAMIEVEGPWESSILGYVGSGEGTVAKGTGLAPGTTGTLAQADNFVYSTLIYRGGDVGENYVPSTAAATDSFSLQAVMANPGTGTDNNFPLCGAHFYRVVSATTALNPTLTWSMTSTDSLLTVAQIAVFKKEAAAGISIPVAMHHYRQQGMA